MPVNVFVSFDHDDAAQVGGFKALVQNENHPLDFHDHSLPEPVKDKSGRIIRYPPGEPASEPVRREIRRRFESASRLVVLIGDRTHRSEWVDWEIREFYRMKQSLSGEKTWKRIRGMRLKGRETATTPEALFGRSTQALDWDPEQLDRWFDSELE